MATASVVEWPTITDLRHLLVNITKDPEIARVARHHSSSGGIEYRGKVKLHGANHAATVCANGEYFLQSRTVMLGDKSGFARWARQHANFFSGLWSCGVNRAPVALSSALRACPAQRFTVFGEWAGPGVQRGSSVAVSKLPSCVFCVFGVAFVPASSKDGELAIIVMPDDILLLMGGQDALPAGMHVIPWMPEACKKLDVLDSTSAAFVQQAHEIDRLVASVDAEDPWVREAFGVRGPGEGIVWYPVSLCDAKLGGAIKANLFAALSWKAKGLAHQMVQGRAATSLPHAVPSCLDATPVARSAEDFAFMFCTRARMLQGLTEACPELVLDELPAFLAWMVADIRKEGKVELEAAGLHWEAVEPLIRERCQAWFREQLAVKEASSLPPAVHQQQQCPPLSGASFCFSESVPFKTKGGLSKRIKEAGGVVLFNLSKKCTHLIVVAADIQQGGPSLRVTQAVSFGSAIVSYVYLLFF